MVETYWLVEYTCEHQEEYNINEVDHSDCNVEGVSLFVHPGSKNANSDEEDGFGYHQSNSLRNRSVLSKSDKHSFYEDIQKSRENKVICCCAELDVEKSPFVQSRWVRVKDVGRIAVHLDRASGDTNDLESSPQECKTHCNDVEKCEYYFGCRVPYGELP